MSAAGLRMIVGRMAFGLVTLLASSAHAQVFSTPVGCDDCINYWYYVDHGGGTDYTCGGVTYDGHRGTDYSLKGGNGAIDGAHEIVAAAAGIVAVATDGNFDRCTACSGDGCGTNTPGGGYANHVVIDHGTYRTTYGHMRNGSVAVSVGERVECGQVLGHIGSSGCSSGAHLHFQPELAGVPYGELLDPYAGECSTTTPSLWFEQGPYQGVPGHACSDLPPECPSELSESWSCSQDGTTRRRCVDGIESTENCEWGCEASTADDLCLIPPDADADGARADTDCDDFREEVHPGALEECGDGIDQDCNGADQMCDPSGQTGSGGGHGLSTGGNSATGGNDGHSTGTSGEGESTGGDTSSGGASSNLQSTPEQSGCQCVWRASSTRSDWVVRWGLIGFLLGADRLRRASRRSELKP